MPSLNKYLLSTSSVPCVVKGSGGYDDEQRAYLVIIEPQFMNEY